jgi:hypothetical protein
MDVIIIYYGYMVVADGSVTLNTGLTPTATAAPGPEAAKVSFPPNTDFYIGGKFDLGSLLSSIPGRILRGLSGLVSGLLGPEEEGEHPVVKTARRVVRAIPTISRQIAALPEAEEE